MRLSESDSRKLPVFGHRFADRRLIMTAHKNLRRQIIYKKKGKSHMRRNSFIEMAKLHDLSGRITYISSHAKQEHLYEVYATEPDRRSGGNLPSVIRKNLKKAGRMESASKQGS